MPSKSKDHSIFTTTIENTEAIEKSEGALQEINLNFRQVSIEHQDSKSQISILSAQLERL